MVIFEILIILEEDNIINIILMEVNRIIKVDKLSSIKMFEMVKYLIFILMKDRIIIRDNIIIVNVRINLLLLSIINDRDNIILVRC